MLDSALKNTQITFWIWIDFITYWTWTDFVKHWAWISQ